MDTFYSVIAGSRQEKAQTCVWIFKATLRWPVEGQRFTPCPLFCVIFELLHSPFWIRKRGPLFCFVAHNSPCYILVSDFIFFSFFFFFEISTWYLLPAQANKEGHELGRGEGGCVLNERITTDDADNVNIAMGRIGAASRNKVISTFNFWLPLVFVLHLLHHCVLTEQVNLTGRIHMHHVVDENVGNQLSTVTGWRLTGVLLVLHTIIGKYYEYFCSLVLLSLTHRSPFSI